MNDLNNFLDKLLEEGLDKGEVAQGSAQVTNATGTQNKVMQKEDPKKYLADTFMHTYRTLTSASTKAAFKGDPNTALLISIRNQVYKYLNIVGRNPEQQTPVQPGQSGAAPTPGTQGQAVQPAGNTFNAAAAQAQAPAAPTPGAQKA